MELTIPSHPRFKPPNFVERHKILNCHTQLGPFSVKNPFTRNISLPHKVKNNIFCGKFCVPTRASSSDGDKGEVLAAQEQSLASEYDTLSDIPSSSNDGYVALFIRMLGLDNDPLDREQAVITLWKYSLGGKQFIDNIMKFRGIINLIVNLLKSDSESACEAAAGLLRAISSIDVYRDLVAESAAIEEITGLLRRSSLSSDVKEQSICTLCNLSVDEKIRSRITYSDLLPRLVKLLEDEHLKVSEAAAGVLANLTLSDSNHAIMVEAGIIPKMANLLKADLEESKSIKKVARNALLELAKDDYNHILIIEEGLILVPLVGSSAYKSFRPILHSWPSLPDGTKIEQTSKIPSKFGASELLLGLNIQENENADLEERKTKAILGRTQQQFLARIGAIEIEENNTNQIFTILPWMDGVARLILILGLEDESAIARAAWSIGDASVNGHMRVSFMEGGALKNLVSLINHPNEKVRFAVVRALDKLAISNEVCHKLESEGVSHPLIYLMKNSNLETSHNLTSMILSILTRVLDPHKEMKSKVWDGIRNTKSVNGDDTISSRLTSRDFVDSSFLSCLVDTLKSSNADLQRKASSVLEFIIEIEQCVEEELISAGIESGLEVVFQQKSLIETQDEIEFENQELRSLKLEEAGLAVSAASQLLTRLLDFDQFRQTLNSDQFTKLLRIILVSKIPLKNKDYVAACLVKLSSLSGTNFDLDINPIYTEITIYETIPRLIEKIKSSGSFEVQETAVVELNRIVFEGFVNSTRAVAYGGGIFPLVDILENGSDRAKEASLAILYNLSMDSENHATIIAAGIVPILRKIVISQRGNWTRALRLLRNLPT